MKISFDKSIKIAGIGIAPWPRLGPERWLDNYKIASYFGWDVGGDVSMPENFSMKDADPGAKLEKLNTPNMLSHRLFQDILNKDLEGYSFLTYKTVDIPDELQDRNFLMVDVSVSEAFENKVEFRRMFGSILKMPSYRVYNRADLAGTEEEFKTLAQDRLRFVLQDEQLSGGKGTFIVDDYSSYKKALANLKDTSTYRRVVVSDVVKNARERSIQACITKHGVFCGPLQRQIVRNPYLANLESATGDKWCGIQIYKSDQETELQSQAEQAAQKVGEALKETGYKGIFGIDFLLDDNDEMFVIEVNPRITGATPLLAALFNDNDSIPFYMLHILELGQFDYKIESQTAKFDEDGALIVFHSLENYDVIVRDKPSSGTYVVDDGKLVKVSGNLDIKKLKSGEWVLQEYTNPHMAAKAGARILTAQTKNDVIDRETDELTEDAQNDVRTIYNSMRMEPFDNGESEKKELTFVGRVEKVRLPIIGGSHYARIDTGATYSSICGSAEEVEEGLEVTFMGDSESVLFREYSTRVIQSSMGHAEKRYTIKMPVVLKKRRINATFTIADRSRQTYPVLIGRNVLMNKFYVDVSKGSPQRKKEKMTRQRMEDSA